MPQATYHFPRGFLWGTATSSHQVEGNNVNNNWWAWEQQEGKIAQGHKSGLACDWWGGRWKEDLDRSASADQNAHRFSIEWSRIQPAPDRWDENALDRYISIMRGLKERGLTPLVTLHHFTDPIWLAERGGWANEGVVEYFGAYVAKVVEALRDYVNLWVTVNEPNVLVVSSYLLGIWPPEEKSITSTIQVMTNLVRAHAAAYRTIHRLQPQARVGSAHNYRPFLPKTPWSPLDRGAAGLYSFVFNEFFPGAMHSGVLRFPGWFRRVPEAKNTQDFLGLNYYNRDYIDANPFKIGKSLAAPAFPPGTDVSASGMFANEPEGMFQAIRWALKFGLPIYITENGIEDADDHVRPRFIVQQLHQVWRAVNFNFPVRGYFFWSLVDNFEWERGWTQRFGLWELDPATQARRKRTSADLYAEICRENGLSSDMVARYTPEVLSQLFPD